MIKKTISVSLICILYNYPLLLVLLIGFITCTIGSLIVIYKPSKNKIKNINLATNELSILCFTTFILSMNFLYKKAEKS